jgi:ATP-dependent RNA helicase SUPV3L1/SUV3
MTSLLGTAGDDFNSILTSLGYRVRRTPKVAAITPPVETEAQIDAAAEAVTNADATAAVEGTSAEAGASVPEETAAESAAVETATADLGAAPPPAETPAPGEAPAEPATAEASAETAKPAEPEFDEVWFPGGRRPDNPRHQNRRPHREGANGDGQEQSARPPRRFNRDNAAPRPAGDKPEGQQARPPRPDRPDKPRKNFGVDKKPYEGGKKFAGKRERDDDWKQHRPREKRDVPLDPDSPWAALAALRNPKPE